MASSASAGPPPGRAAPAHLLEELAEGAIGPYTEEKLDEFGSMQEYGREGIEFAQLPALTIAPVTVGGRSIELAPILIPNSTKTVRALGFRV